MHEEAVGHLQTGAHSGACDCSSGRSIERLLPRLGAEGEEEEGRRIKGYEYRQAIRSTATAPAPLLNEGRKSIRKRCDGRHHTSVFQARNKPRFGNENV